MSAKEFLNGLIPRPAVEWGKSLLFLAPALSAKRALINADYGPEWLDLSQLAPLSKEYPVTNFWSEDQEELPADDRARELKRLFGRSKHTLLEIGGGPGHVAWAMANAGHNVTILDMQDEVIPAARSAGVKAVIGNAENIDFPSNSFDGAWSFNSFEHIHQPRLALDEMWRVVRSGGLIHLSFAPIFNAPLGQHAFLEIGIPYCQHLWSEDDLRAISTSKDLWNLNKLSIYDYRNIWKEFSRKLHSIKYSEQRDYRGIELIKRFPTCFSKLSKHIEYFTISKIVVTFRVEK